MAMSLAYGDCSPWLRETYPCQRSWLPFPRHGGTFSNTPRGGDRQLLATRPGVARSIPRKFGVPWRDIQIGLVALIHQTD